MIELRFVPILQWPGVPTKERKFAPFRASYTKTLALMKYELQRIDARRITIQAFYTDTQLRNDGWPKANCSPSHPGVVLSFKKPYGEAFKNAEGQRMISTVPLSFPCDTYLHMESNMHAIALSLTALRAVDRYGVTRGSEQYQGWKQIEAPTPAGFASKEDAAGFMSAQGNAGVSPQWTAEIIDDPTIRQEVYKRAARRLHPDAATGNHELFVKLQQANAMLEGQA